MPFPAALPVAGLHEAQVWLLAGVLLGLTGFFAAVRQSLLRAVPDRVLARVSGDARSKRIGKLLERTESLASSASALKLSCDLVFLLFVLVLMVES